MASVEKKNNNSVVINLYIQLYDSFEKDNSNFLLLPD